MTTSDLERRLAVVLQQHAEDAMNSTRTEEKLESLRAETERRGRRRRLSVGAGALVAAAAAVAFVTWLVGPGVNRTEEVVPAREPSPEQVATAFLGAYGSFDRDRAASYLADDAYLSIWPNSRGRDVWRQGNRWFEAIGFRMLGESCEEQDGGSSSGTAVLCTFDYHALRSDELGRGPFSGNTFLFAVRDGEITYAEKKLDFMANGFSEQMWEPFAAWVSEAHPRDASVMYRDWPGRTLEALTARSAELWEQHSREYVQEQTVH